MGDATKIQWCDFTFNPWSGCSKVSEGCRFCYAETNYSVKMRGVKWGPNGTRVLASDSMWKQPLKWNRQAETANRMNAIYFPGMVPVRPRVFCASLADVFEDWQGEIMDHNGIVKLKDDGSWQRQTMGDVRDRLFALIDATPWLDWLLLTKRPENVRRMMPPYTYHACHTGDCPHDRQCDCNTLDEQKHRDNLWLGCSIATQADVNKNIPELEECSDLAPVRFVSAEPLIECIDLSLHFEKLCINWLIIGGESGSHARPCDVAWIRSLKDQAQVAGVACFVKQLGAVPFDTGYQPAGGWWPNQTSSHEEIIDGKVCFVRRLRDKKGGEPSEWPADLRVREFPKELVHA